MSNRKNLRRKRQMAGVSTVLSAVMIFNLLATMPVMARWVYTDVPVVNYRTETFWVSDGGTTTNGVPTGHWDVRMIRIAPYTKTVKTWVPDSSTTEPIDTTTGNNYFTERRMQIPCPGIPLELNLKYQSVTSTPEGNLGKRWHHSYEWSLDDQTNNVTVYTAAGSKMIFESDGNDGYEPPEGSNWELEAFTDGYKVILPEGMFYGFNTDGQLARIRDAWGTQVTCSYNSTNNCLWMVHHSNGRSLAFHNEWNSGVGDWRVSKVLAMYGSTINFEYNADGQFTQVVEQVSGNSYTSSYQYADGYLTNKVNGAGFEYAFDYEIGDDGLLNGKGTHLEVAGYYPHDVAYPDESTSEVTYYQRGLEKNYRYARDQYGSLSERFGPALTMNAV